MFYTGSATAKNPRRLCSRKCADAFMARHSITMTCVRCGAEYRVRPSQRSRRSIGGFCSKRCEGDSKIKRPLDRVHNGRIARLDQHGYVMLYEPDHPKAGNGGWFPEHRLVMEQQLGRALRTDEHVHHINGIKNDNRLENLTIMDANDHAALSSRDYRHAINAKLKRLADYERRFGSQMVN
jgi:ribosomal protein S27AE